MGEEVIGGSSRRMTHLKGVGGGDKLAAIPEADGRFESEQIDDGADETQRESYQFVYLVHVKLPVYNSLIEDILAEFVDDLFNQSVFDGGEVAAGVVVFISREALLEVGLLVEGVGEAHLDGDGETVHRHLVLAREGGGAGGVTHDFAFDLEVAVGVGDVEGGLRCEHIAQVVGELLAQLRVHRRSVVGEGLDGDGFGTRRDGSSGETVAARAADKQGSHQEEGQEEEV